MPARTATSMVHIEVHFMPNNSLSLTVSSVHASASWASCPTSSWYAWTKDGNRIQQMTKMTKLHRASYRLQPGLTCFVFLSLGCVSYRESPFVDGKAWWNTTSLRTSFAEVGLICRSGLFILEPKEANMIDLAGSKLVETAYVSYLQWFKAPSKIVCPPCSARYFSIASHCSFPSCHCSSCCCPSCHCPSCPCPSHFSILLPFKSRKVLNSNKTLNKKFKKQKISKFLVISAQASSPSEFHCSTGSTGSACSACSLCSFCSFCSTCPWLFLLHFRSWQQDLLSEWLAGVNSFIEMTTYQTYQ